MRRIILLWAIFWITFALFVLFIRWIHADQQEQRQRVGAVAKEVVNNTQGSEHPQGWSFTGANSEATPPLTVPEAAGDSQPKAILAQETLHLEHLVSESLHGKINVNAALDLIAEFAQFELNPLPVEGWRDPDVEVFEFLIGSEDVHAQIEISKDPEGHRSGIRIVSSANSFSVGAFRRGHEIIAYFDNSEDGRLSGFSLQLYAKVLLGESRRKGVECYRGEFREGVIFANNQAFQFGIKDGKPVRFDDPCTGDLNLDPERVRLLWNRIQMLKSDVGQR